MLSESEVPSWLWRSAVWVLALCLAVVTLLAVALALGLADPRPVGTLRWQVDFKSGVEGWTLIPPPNGGLAPEGGALVADFIGAHSVGDDLIGAGEIGVEFAGAAQAPVALGLTPGPEGDFTLEVAGAAAGADNTAAYGLVFGWQDERHFSAVLVNGSGYATAFRRDGSRSVVWFEWQQWPHILAGESSNRIRVDVRGQAVTVRINDEVLVTAPRATAHGQVGVLARSARPGQVIFSWVKLWAR